jgi:branched-chain amino acid aminotransferase
MKVEKRHIEVSEREGFEETGACGTAAVITPIRKIVDRDKDRTYSYGDGSNPGPVTTKLYEKLIGIQYGDVEDPYGWITILD